MRAKAGPLDPSVVAECEHRTGARKGEVALAPTELGEARGGACGPSRELYRDQHLVRFDGRSQTAHEEVARVQRPLSARVAQPEMPAECGDDSGQFSGRVGMRETAADRPAISDLSMSDMPNRLAEERARLARKRGLFHRAVPG